MAAERRLSVDWPACKGHGLCAELVPELVALDEWGYPILADRPVTRGVQAHAQRAVAACPTLALMLMETTTPSSPPKPGAEDPITGAIKAATGPNPVQRRSSSTPATPPTGSVRRRSAPVTPEPVQNHRQEPVRRRRGGSVQPDADSAQWGRPEPAEDPITGAIRAVTGPNAAPRRTPPTGMARHATPAYGQPALVPEADPYVPGDAFFDGYEPRDAYQPQSPRPGQPGQPPKPAQPTSRREAKQNQKPLTRREARARRQ